MSSFIYRETTTEDLTYIKRLNLLTETFGDEFGDVDPEEFRAASQFYVDAWNPERGGVLVFDGLGIPAGGTWLLWGDKQLHGTGYVGPEVPELAIAVETRFGRRGIGGQLLERAAELAADLGAPALSLCVHEQNPGARALYERHGFEFHSQEEANPYAVMLRDFSAGE